MEEGMHSIQSDICKKTMHNGILQATSKMKNTY